MLCTDWPSVVNMLIVLEIFKAYLENSEVTSCVAPITLISNFLTICTKIHLQESFPRSDGDNLQML